MIAVEKDSRFLKHLERIPGDVKVLRANALDVIGSLRFDRIISNIPYAISEPLIRKLPSLNFRKAVLTVPKRFAMRLAAKKPDALYSELSFFTQTFFLPEMCFEVPRSSFFPRPGTASVVIALTPRKRSLAGDIFMRRKSKLRNAILQALTGGRGRKKMTKREARKLINMLPINKILDKRVRELNLDELESVGCEMKKHTRTDNIRTS